MHSFIHSVSQSVSHSVIQSFSHSVIQSFIYSFIHSFIHSLVHSFVRSFIHSFIRSFIDSCIHLPRSLPSLPPSMQTLHYIASYTYPKHIQMGRRCALENGGDSLSSHPPRSRTDQPQLEALLAAFPPNSDKFARSDSSACPQIIPNLFLLLTPLMIDVFWSLFLWR